MTIPRLTFFNQCEISDYLLGQMLGLGVVQHFTTINVGMGLFNPLQQPNQLHLLTSSGKCCLSDKMLGNIPCRTIIFPSKLDFILVVMTIDFNL
jgi:hypothetical protein